MAFSIFSSRALFFISLVIVTLFYLPNIPYAEAGNGGFSIHLIHRDSPRSPFYNPSDSLSDRVTKAIRRSNSRADYFRISSTPYSVSSSSNSIRSEVVPNGGSYLMSLSFGTPPVEFLAIADTGSDLIWTQCKPCDGCYEQEAPLFDPLESSTYRNISCQSNPCQALPQSSCNIDSSCEYSYNYGDQSYTAGVVATETLTFDTTERSSVKIPRMAFGCSHSSGGSFEAHGAGLVGLGGGPLSLISQLGSSIEGKFSYCLVPLLGSNTNTTTSSSSQLNFGDNAVVFGSGVVSTPLVPKEPNTFYYLTLEEIKVGEINVKLQTAAEKGNIVIDSGTTLTYLETSVYEEFVSALKESMTHITPIQDPSQPLDTCYEAAGPGPGPDPTTFPDMTFRFTGADLILKPLNTFIEIYEGVVCLAVLPMEKFSIFGNIAQQNFQVGYDLVGEKVSFAPTDCTTN